MAEPQPVVGADMSSSSKKKRSTYLNTFFPGDIAKLQEGVNYSEETLAYMTPYGKSERLANTASKLMGASIVIDACAGIGGNTIGFGLNDEVKHVISYERDRERWEMLHNNLSTYKLSGRCSAFNQEFDVGEDLQLLDVTRQNPEHNCVVYFDPPWLNPGASIDKSNYILSGIRLSGRSLEEWAQYLCHTKGYRGVIYHLPREYKMVLPGHIIDDKSDNKARLIYYSALDSVNQKLLSTIGLQQQEPVKPDVKPDTVSSHEEPLEVIPAPVVVQGPKAILQTFLTPDFPAKVYYRADSNPKAIHSGQRKLLLSEIEFLTRVLKTKAHVGGEAKYTLLYVGAAPGIHIPILSEMFPEVTFLLYDPAPFTIKPTDKIKIFQQLFTDDDVKQYVQEDPMKSNLLFVSDIRSTPRQGYQAPEELDPEFENEVIKNLQQQKNWVERIKPLRSLLKFRLPFTSPDEQVTTSYFDGVIFFQAYAPPHSTETRLEVGPVPKEISYSHTKYEQQMFYFNTVYRVQAFVHYNRRYGWSYDTIREFFILKKYLEMRGRGNRDIPMYFAKFDEMTKDPAKKISKILSRY